MPLFHAPGNHDICDIHTTNWSEQHPLAGYGPYTRYLGPIRYSFSYAGVRFVALTAGDSSPVGAVRTSAVRARADRLYRVRVVVECGRLFVQVNNRVQYEAPFDVKDALAVELFAEGGTAAFRGLEVWELKPAK